jgi:acyl dehydratase
MADDPISTLAPGALIGTSAWVPVTQSMISDFGRNTLDPDPMHVDPEWARAHSPFGGTIAFGFQTISLLTHLLYSATQRGPDRAAAAAGYHLNYGFNRLRLITPVPVDSRVRGEFRLKERTQDRKGRWITTMDCAVSVAGAERQALFAEWLTIWVPPAP